MRKQWILKMIIRKSDSALKIRKKSRFFELNMHEVFILFSNTLRICLPI